jgi:hypothetical protein
LSSREVENVIRQLKGQHDRSSADEFEDLKMSMISSCCLLMEARELQETGEHEVRTFKQLKDDFNEVLLTKVILASGDLKRCDNYLEETALQYSEGLERDAKWDEIHDLKTRLQTNLR